MKCHLRRQSSTETNEKIMKFVPFILLLTISITYGQSTSPVADIKFSNYEIWNIPDKETEQEFIHATKGELFANFQFAFVMYQYIVFHSEDSPVDYVLGWKQIPKELQRKIIKNYSSSLSALR